MSEIGHSINGGLVAVVVVVVAGTVGATLYYQHSVDRLDDRADVLSEHTQTLEQNLTATRADLRAQKERARELNRSLAVAESDVSTLSERLEANRERRRAAEGAAWAETEGPDAADGDPDAPERTAAAHTATPAGRADSDARENEPWADESSADGAWDDGLADDGGYGSDAACEERTETETNGTAACEG